MKQKNFVKCLYVIVVLLCVHCISAGAQSNTNGFAVERYKCFYNTVDNQTVNFTVIVSSNSLSIGSQTYSLHRLGTITNQGVEFKSYTYSSSEKMFCVSTTQISYQISASNTKKGYVMFIDKKVYLATKI